MPLPLTPSLPRSGLLLRTTALLTLLPLLAAVQPARAELVIDNQTPPGGAGGTGAVSGTWAADSEIWYDTDTDSHVALGADGGIGVLANPLDPADPGNPNPEVDLTIDGTVRMDVLRVRDDGFTLSGGTISDNGSGLRFGSGGTDSTLSVSAAMSGRIVVGPRLRLNHSGNSTGTIRATVEDNGTLANSGTIGGEVVNNGTLEMDAGSVIGGSVTNNTGGKITVDAAGTEIGGNLFSPGEIEGRAADASVTVGGRLTTDRSNLSADGGNNLAITAAEILLVGDDDIDRDVTLIGTEVNIRDRRIIGTERLAEGEIDGGLLNEDSGRISVFGTLDGSGYDITNEAEFTLERTGWGSGGRVENVGNFVNRGADAELTLEDYTRLSVNNLTNSGDIQNEGRITATNGIRNQAGGSLTNNETLIGNVTNDDGATLTSTDLIEGDVVNDGTATLSGSITGKLTNNSVNAPGDTRFDLGGDLEVGGLENTGSITIDDGETLTSATTALNSGTLEVDGDLTGRVDNFGTLDVTGTITDTITNRSGAALTSTGTIGGLENGSQNAVVSGRVTGHVVNWGSAALTSSAEITGDMTNHGRATLSGSIGGTFTNIATDIGGTTRVDLNGDLDVGRLDNQGDLALVAGRTLTSRSTATNAGTLGVAGTLNGAVDNSGTMDVTGTLTGTITNRIGATLTSTGTIGGLNNASENAQISGTVTGNVVNWGVGTLVSSADIGGDLTNHGKATLSGSVAPSVPSSSE